MTTAVPDVPSVRARVLTGVAWKAGSAVTLQLSRAITSIILARLLLPSQYGLASMALVASSLVFVFADVGLGAALVQRREVTEADRSTVFWISVFVGSLLTAVGILCSGYVADFYGRSAVGPLFAVFSISFVLTAISSTHIAMFTREMDFRSLELRQIISYLAGAAVGISAAATGAGAWAIIFQQLTISAVGTALLLAFQRWRPRLVFSRASLRSLGGFGGNVFGTRLLFYCNRNADNILIGRFLGAGPLGAYTIAYNVMLLPFSQLAGPLQEVLFPAFARVQADSARVGSMWLRANRVVGSITIPAFLGLAVVAPDFVEVLLGNRWRGAIRVMQILCFVGLLQSVQRMNSSVLEARDRTGVLLRFSVVSFAVSITSFALGLHWGIVGVATAYLIANLVLQPYYARLACRAVELRLRDFVLALTRATEAAIVMAVVVYLAREALISAQSGAAVRLIVLIAMGFVVYLPLLLLRDRALRTELRELVASRRASSQA
jgi:O-antigen/teichoic acid export membrane protein